MESRETLHENAFGYETHDRWQMILMSLGDIKTNLMSSYRIYGNTSIFISIDGVRFLTGVQTAFSKSSRKTTKIVCLRLEMHYVEPERVRIGHKDADCTREVYISIRVLKQLWNIRVQRHA